jgi:hypothetical protein
LIHRVVRHAPAPVARCGRDDARGSRFGLRSCSEPLVARSNESLHRTSAWGLPCRSLASPICNEHLLAWRAGACR